MLTYLLVNDEAVCLKLYQLLKLVIQCNVDGRVQNIIILIWKVVSIHHYLCITLAFIVVLSTDCISPFHLFYLYAVFV